MNLREFVDLLEEKGRLQRVTREVGLIHVQGSGLSRCNS